MSAVNPADTFRQEAQELLEQLEHALLDLEHTPANSELIDSAFRALHTIKGSGAMFGFEKVAAFTHHVETAFDLVRKGKVAPTAQLIALTLSAKDHMRRLIEEPEKADMAAGDAILAELQTVVGSAPAPAAVATNTPSAPAANVPETWRIRFRLPKDAMAMGTNPLLLLDELRALGPATVTAQTSQIPALDALTPTECHVGWDVVLTAPSPKAAIENVFLFVLDDMELSIERIDGPAEDKKLGEILVERRDTTPEAVSAALATQLPVGKLLVEAGAVAEDKVASALAEQKHLRTETKTAKAEGSVRVPAERLDELMDRVGELVIAQSRLKQVAASSLDMQVKSVAEEIERLARELQDTTMGVRMVPIGSLFSRFRRLVHDLSRDLSKDIELVTSGEETELDKTVIERLNDPLVHLIRNAGDHGLETPEARAAAGKGKARISLTARHAGAEVHIVVSDDGKGLDRERVRAKAEEQGLIQPGAKLSDNEIYQLIFQPGFSTAKEVTNLSGRGVGMDVVKRTIEGLRGTIDVTSASGKGTSVTLRIPLTLAIIEGLLVRVGNGRYVIPLASVEECVELTQEDDTKSTGRSFLNIRNKLVPFLRLREMFRSTQPADRYQKVVIVSSGEQRIGLVVDQVIGDHQTVIKSLSKLHADVKTFAGATILGDGSVALILDVAQLVDFGQAQNERLKAAG
jgi:two-component system, chemotaxis family, sensor kinase CheA